MISDTASFELEFDVKGQVTGQSSNVGSKVMAGSGTLAII